MCQKKLADAQAKERKDETAADSATTNLENSERASVKSSEEVTRFVHSSFHTKAFHKLNCQIMYFVGICVQCRVGWQCLECHCGG